MTCEFRSGEKCLPTAILHLLTYLLCFTIDYKLATCQLVHVKYFQSYHIVSLHN